MIGWLNRSAFTLIELLVVVALIALLIGLMLPTLGAARESGRVAVCLSNLRQLGAGWALYADAHDERVMPLAYTRSGDTGGGASVYWWGAIVDRRVEHERGFLAPFLEGGPHESSAYECPSQGWGTYTPQSGVQEVTSTYGYNGYYLSPPKTPGWDAQIGHRPWRTLADIERASEVFVFGDSLYSPSVTGRVVYNNALLDPPMLYRGSSGWRENRSPTTSFRHGGVRLASADAVHADGSARGYSAPPDELVVRPARIGSVGARNDPHYVPDWTRWANDSPP